MSEPRRLFDFPLNQLRDKPLDRMMTSMIDGEWVTYSSADFVTAMNSVSRGLLKIGVQPGQKIALISHNNRCEWNVMDHAILQIAAIDVPVYPTMSAADFEYIFNHAEVSHAVVSNAEMFEKVQSIRDNVPTLKNVYTFENVDGATNWKELHEPEDDAAQKEVERLRATVKTDDLATLIYTSGTTGKPKGVMLSHSNIVSNVLGCEPRLPQVIDREYRVLSFLPVCHIYERMLHYLYMRSGATIYFAQSLETIKEDLNYAQPQTFTAVPRLLEKFYDGIVAKGRAAGGVKTMLFNWSVNLALKWHPDRQNGAFYEFKLGIARKLVFSKVKAALGLTDIQAVASGSAALQPRLAQFFNGAGIPVFEGYGLTETSPVITVNTTNLPGMLRIGTVGKMIEHVEVKIAPDGEILCKGPNVMIGYYKDPEKTAEVLKDGWFHTGDIGEIEDGFLKITDRKKEIFKTSGGKYVAPQVIENAMKASIFIEQIMVIGEGQKHPSALIAPSFDVVREWCKRHKIPYTTDEEMIGNKKLTDRIQQDIDDINSKFGHWEQIKKVRFLPKQFSIEGGELTPTLKLRRKPIMEKYAEVINTIYSD